MSGKRGVKAKASAKSKTKSEAPLLVLSKNLDICPICQNEVESEEEGLNCEECQQWWHAPCCKISHEKYQWLTENDNILFVCDNCKNDKQDADQNISNAALMKQMKEMMVCMKEVLNNHSKMSAENAELAARVSKLEKNSNSAAAIPEEKLKVMIDDKVNEAMQDAREQDERRLNLIMVNIPENTGVDSKEKDKEAISTLMKKILPEEEVGLDQVMRLGEKNIGTRPRLVKIKVKSTETKRKILKNASLINDGSGVTDPRNKMYINVDFTKKERDINKALRTELRNKPSEERQRYVIRNCQLVLKDRTAEAAVQGQA